MVGSEYLLCPLCGCEDGQGCSKDCPSEEMPRLREQIAAISLLFAGARDALAEVNAENERLKAELNTRCPVDAMERGMSPLEATVWHVWGDRCSDFEPECWTCRAWAEFDHTERLRAALNADDQTLRLHLGEMTAQEMRTLRAGFRWVWTRAALGGDA